MSATTQAPAGATPNTAATTTRIAVFADVHGNLPALEAVIADLRRRGVDTIVNLGDCVSGPLWPRETAEMLMASGIATVRGNHDRWVLDRAPERMGHSDRFAAERLTPAHRDWLAKLPPALTPVPGVAAFHALPEDDLAYALDEIVDGRLVLAPRDVIAQRLKSVAAGVALCGHTHQPRVARLPNGALAVNPGSVGCPAYHTQEPVPHASETGAPHARYAILSVGREASVTMIAVEYDHESAARRAEENGQAGWAHALRTGYARAD